LKEQRYLRAFGKARDRLRAEEGKVQDAGNQFYERQAAYMGEILHAGPEMILKKTEKIIYRNWEPIFKGVKLFPQVIETLKALKEAGVKLGLLSDFPPETKLEYMGLSGLWDTVLCSEAIGCLKPGALPFRELARNMGYAPEEMLYVGNSFRYDVLGAQKTGMKAAWVVSGLKARGLAGSAKKAPSADFVFSDYRQLRDYVLI
jgi:putative hydrolase of the HAD superfamily